MLLGVLLLSWLLPKTLSSSPGFGTPITTTRLWTPSTTALRLQIVGAVFISTAALCMSSHLLIWQYSCVKYTSGGHLAEWEPSTLRLPPSCVWLLDSSCSLRRLAGNLAFLREIANAFNPTRLVTWKPRSAILGVYQAEIIPYHLNFNLGR